MNVTIHEISAEGSISTQAGSVWIKTGAKTGNCCILDFEFNPAVFQASRFLCFTQTCCYVRVLVCTVLFGLVESQWSEFGESELTRLSKMPLP